LLKLTQDGPTQHVGQKNVERYRGRLKIPSQSKRVGSLRRDQHFKAETLGKVFDDSRIMRIVFNDQKHLIARFDGQPIVGDWLNSALINDGRRPVLRISS